MALAFRISATGTPNRRDRLKSVSPCARVTCVPPVPVQPAPAAALLAAADAPDAMPAAVDAVCMPSSTKAPADCTAGSALRDTEPWVRSLGAAIDAVAILFVAPYWS